MKTLEEHNEEARLKHTHPPRGNNIECPNCGDELYDSSPSMVLLSYPPQHPVACFGCDFKGTRY